MSILSLLFGRRPKGVEPRRADPSLGPLPAAAANVPSADPGLLADSTDSLLGAHADLLARLKLCYGADKAGFEQDLLVPIRRLAGYVNALPATADNYFCDRGGLLRLALEVAFFALQGTDGHIVDGKATISSRRVLEPRWRLATFYAGLCSELHRTLSQLVVTDEQGAEWPAYLEGLSPWLTSRGSKRFFVRWMANTQESRALGIFALRHVLSPETAQYLATGNRVVMPQLMASITGTPCVREQSLVVELVRRSTALVINRDLITNANRYGRPILGAHIERYLIDAMRRLVIDHPAWSPNQERSRVWHARDGLFVVWPNAAGEIRKLLEADELPGIPQDPQTILEILLGAGVAVRHPGGAALWPITPQQGKPAVDAMKLIAPEVLLTGFTDHKPMDASILGAGPSAAPANASQPAQVARRAAPAPTATVTAPQPAPDAMPNAAPHALLHSPAAASLDSSPQPATSQLDLLSDAVQDPQLDEGDDAIAPDAGESEGDGAQNPPSPAPYRLVAPFRLAPQVRDALSAAVDTLNGDAKTAQAITVPTGIFIPLEHFKRYGVDAAVVLRSMDELSMAVVHGGRTKTVQHDFGGRECLGFILLPQFVDGLDASLFIEAQENLGAGT